MDVDVRVLVLNNKNEVLLVLEKGGVKTMPDGRSFEKPSKWGLPGGRSESGDGDAFDTAIREVEEETGLSIYINEKIQIKEQGDDYTKVAFVGEPAGSKIKINPEEILTCKWFPISVLSSGQLDMYSRHRRVAQELLRKLGR